eukprot:CAMPEP_0174344634 /NCGR_PEP_ID=MMETSP0810-20121108/27781_1 /TAXON_ID=73025 ORGANISM="Eutreptiella gymnastica-like, Strain CCMP1594" /NCGR_SAMPLE_ID=MMETSP0810 /ASSEMBLY_ACC=CAM_ASM_000659 /LENGTH=110 /DNA_ID=CAMNT_0015467813 /DNA_START=728 /DNA_END=1060 /DNA_ORIENTATION=-
MASDTRVPGKAAGTALALRARHAPPCGAGIQRPDQCPSSRSAPWATPNSIRLSESLLKAGFVAHRAPAAEFGSGGGSVPLPTHQLSVEKARAPRGGGHPGKIGLPVLPPV